MGAPICGTGDNLDVQLMSEVGRPHSRTKSLACGT